MGGAAAAQSIFSILVADRPVGRERIFLAIGDLVQERNNYQRKVVGDVYLSGYHGVYPPAWVGGYDVFQK